MWMIAEMPLPQISEATIDKLLNASLPTLAFIVIIMTLAILAPVLWYLSRRDAKANDVLMQVVKQNGETLELLKRQTKTGEDRNAMQAQQGADIKAIAVSNAQVADVAQRMAAIVGGFTAVKDEAVKDIKEHTSAQTDEVTKAMNAALAEVLKQLAEVRGMVVSLGEKSSADVKAILERIDSIQHVTDKLPDTGPLPALPDAPKPTTEPLQPDPKPTDNPPKEGN